MKLKLWLAGLALCALPLVAAPLAAHAQAGYVVLTTPPGNTGLTCYQGMVYGYAGTAPGGGYLYAPGGSSCGTTTGGGRSDPYARAISPVFDGPNSVQYRAMREALDLESIDVEGDARFTAEGDADTVGGAGTYFSAPGGDGERLEGRYESTWRPFEGSRTRALINAPVSATVANDGSGAADVSGILSGGLEIPVKPNWSLTPRAGLGGAIGSSMFGGDGVLGTLSLSSRYRFPQIARGDLVLGNMIAYTGESTFGSQNVILRNGIAYQFPLKSMFFGRQVSVRASYVNTYIDGNAVGLHDYNELALNFGVRMREQDVRNKFELLRFGILYTSADHYDAVTATVGYRF